MSSIAKSFPRIIRTRDESGEKRIEAGSTACTNWVRIRSPRVANLQTRVSEMGATQLNEIFKATTLLQRASVQGMSKKVASTRILNSRFPSAYSRNSSVTRRILVASTLFFLQFVVLMPSASAVGLQSNADVPPQSEVASLSPNFSESLRPALLQVGNTVSQININHWKLSKSWKVQLQSDADSIQQDLSHQLPDLFQQADASPAALDAQMRVMQNVDALYDVLVRLTMAANLTDKKSDAAMLNNSLERLESARKAATAQMVREAALQNRQLVQMQARVQENASGRDSSSHVKTIVVNNDLRHETRHRRIHHRRAEHSSRAAKSGANAGSSSAGNPSPHD